MVDGRPGRDGACFRNRLLVGHLGDADDGPTLDATPQLERERACVDPGQRWNAGIDEQLLERDAGT